MKKIIAILLILTFSICAVSCNMQLIDTTYSYDEVIIHLPNGEIIEGKVDSWKDYEDGDQIQVKVNGRTYLVHSTDIVLINN